MDDLKSDERLIRPSRVIRSKISPPPLSVGVVRRPRLESLLARLIEHNRVTYVYASAGAGKTTAILQSAGLLSRPLAWLGIDSTDASTGRLLTYLEAALAPQVPAVAGVATAALAATIPHAEVAGLLADAIGDSPVLLVLDDVERLGSHADALAVVGALARYFPSSARLVIVSRMELAFPSAGASMAMLAVVGEEDLAFTVDEAGQALTEVGQPDIDPVEALVETGGWVTGVLFEAWRSSDHVIGMGGESDPLHGYLAVQILGQMDPEEREFLISTAVLDEVSALSAEALGICDAAVRMHTLRGLRIPASWSTDGKAMRCHPRLREYLLELLSRRGDDELRALRGRFADLLVSRQHYEEAVEAYLAAGLPEGALPIADRVITQVMERTDFALAERWLSSLGAVRREDAPGLVTSELMLAVALEEYGRGVRLADRLAVSGARDELAKRSGRAASLMSWCYFHAGRLQEIKDLLAIAPAGSDTDAVRYALGVADDVTPAIDPECMTLTGSPLDALVQRTHHDRGRLSLINEPLAMPWAATAARPWRVSSLASAGHLEEAFELFQEGQGAAEEGVWLTAVLGPLLSAELGERDVAWRMLYAGRERIPATGSELFGASSLLAEAELLLVLDDDAKGALEVLGRLHDNPVGQAYRCVRELGSALEGLALLIYGQDEGALRALEESVASMRAGDRLLNLPAAAVYLSEARWRAGDQDLADADADLALWAADVQGSNHILLRALARFPGVLSRRLDSECTAESRWHELGRALYVIGVERPARLALGAVQVVEFGRTAILVSDVEAQPRLRKSFELLAFLANGNRGVVRKTEVMEALFDGRSDESAASYLRQAVLRLRKAIPDLLESEAGAGRIRLSDSIHVTTESERVVGLLRAAASLRGAERMQRLLEAIEIIDRGDYLPGLSAVWIDERRDQIAALARDARYEAAEIAFTLNSFALAEQLATEVLRVDPFRETAWRLLMRTAHALGDHDRMTRAFRGAERALAEIGARPTPSTLELFANLRG